MDLNSRLLCIASIVDNCECVIDVGTDHGYIPIYLVKSGVCSRAIASDINKGPLEKASINISLEGFSDRIQCRRGSGLATVSRGEVQGAVIAGMGGNLIRDIIEADLPVFKELEFAVLQPVQNPEVLRKSIYEKGYEIIDEELCISEDKFYEIIKVRYGNEHYRLEEFDYEISPVLLRKKHPLLREFLEFKLNKYYKISQSIQEDAGEAASERRVEVLKRISRLEELISCL